MNSSTISKLMNSKDARFALFVSALFFAVNLFFALRHVMWRDEWMPVLVARDTESYAAFFEQIKYVGRIVFFSLGWALQQMDGSLMLFKTFIVLASTTGVYVFCRFSPFTRLQKALFSFGYFPLYEYGTILRDYSLILALSIGCCALLTSQKWRPLGFAVVVSLLFQTNPFGLTLGCALSATFVYDTWRRGKLSLRELLRPGAVISVLLAMASLGFAVKTMIPPPDIAELVLGQQMRSDSHLARFGESFPFLIRGMLPIPLFGTWNSQFLDPWPVLQALLVVLAIACILAVLSPSRTALVLYCVGLLGLGAVLCHLPWTHLRYHGPYFVLFVLAYWILLSSKKTYPEVASSLPPLRWLRANASSAVTVLLAVHCCVAGIFLMQEQVVPFSGSRDAANAITQSARDGELIIGDPDYAMIAVSGYLGRPVYIASRREMGSFTKVDRRRRPMPLAPEELSRVVQDKLAEERKDVILVTSYPIALPPELGQLIAATRSMFDENYFVHRVFYRPSGN